VSPIAIQTSCLNRNFSDDALQTKSTPIVKMMQIIGNSTQSKFLGLTLRIIVLVVETGFKPVSTGVYTS